MILVLDSSDSHPEDLLAKAGSSGVPQVRGPLLSAPFEAEDQPLGRLRNGDKLHIVAAPSRESNAIVKLLGSLGLSNDVELKQIHLLIDNAGTGGPASFAERFSDDLMRSGYRVREIKAPSGRVRWDEHGLVFIALPDSQEWLRSGPHLNYYTGPAVQEKHRR